jgi:hypothetical protein
MSLRLLACPRCGYDLSGQADAARAANEGRLDGRGVCSECGLEFDWADVLDPWRTRVRGFVEHAERGVFIAVWRTWALALGPSRFWSRVKVEMALRPSRMVLWLVLGPALLWAAGCLAAQLIELPMPWPGLPASMHRHWIEPDDNLVYRGYRYMGYLSAFHRLPAAVTGPLAASLMIPVVLVLLPDTRRLAKIRAGHVLRGAAYGLAWMLPVLLLRDLCRVLSAIWNVEQSASPMRLMWRRSPQMMHGAQPIVQLTHTLWFLWMLVLVLWIMAWWWFALRVGWKVERYERVWWALIIPAWLAAAVAVAFSSDGYRMFT